MGIDETVALDKMVSPGMFRKGKPKGGVIQIWVTRACDKSCFGCTQGSNLGGYPGMITLEQFEEAVLSLKDYFGIIGVFGGNPCLHPRFDLLCSILRKHTSKQQCGLWSNNLNGNGAVARKTFNPAVSNLNVHLDADAFAEIKRDWPEANPFGLTEDSRHSPVYTALQDLIEDEDERWALIADCDINKHWSAMVGVWRNELRAWFCEIAGAQAMLHQHEEGYPDTGCPVYPGWWRQTMDHFAGQARYHCHRCGVPLRAVGELAQADEDRGVEYVTATHRDVYRLKKTDRRLVEVTDIEQLAPQTLNRFTDYMQNAKRKGTPNG